MACFYHFGYDSVNWAYNLSVSWDDCNAVNMWIAGCETVDEIQQIYYGAAVPEQYQSDVLKAYIATEKERAGDVDEPQVTE